MTLDRLSTDRLAALPQEPASSVFIGARVECSRQGEWIPGTIVGHAWDDERGGLVDVDLDRPDATGARNIWTDSHKIRLFAETAAALARQCAEQLAELRAGIEAELGRGTVSQAAE